VGGEGHLSSEQYKENDGRGGGNTPTMYVLELGKATDKTVRQ